MVPQQSPKASEGHGDWAARQRRERVVGLSILGVAFVVSLLGSWWVSARVHGEPGQDRASDSERAGLLGFPDHFDPLGALGRARDASVREDLFGIALSGVRSDGTLEFKAGGKARFVLGSRRGDGPQAPIPPGERRRRDHCGRQEVIIDQQGLRAEGDQPEHDCHGMKGELPDPACGLSQVWKNAIQKGVPQSALAEMEYFKAKEGPAWRFRIPQTEHDYVWYGDCVQELHGDEAMGKIP